MGSTRVSWEERELGITFIILGEESGTEAGAAATGFDVPYLVRSY